jgi:translocation and assembly module TamB
VSAVDGVYRLAGRTLTLSSLSAAMDRSRIDGAGAVVWSGAPDAARWRQALRFEARVAVPEAHLEDLHRWLPEEWRGTGRFTLTAGRAEGTPQAWRGSGRLSSPALTLRGERITDLTAGLTVDPARVEASGVRAVVRDIAVSGAGAWQWASASGRARVEAGPASLAALPGAGGRVAVEGTARASADLTFDGGVISGRASAAAQDVRVAGVRLGRGTAQAELARSALTATVAFPDARLSGTAAGRLAAGQDIAVRAHVTDFDLVPLLARYAVPAAAGEVAGRVSGAADLLVPYSAPADARGSLRLDPVRLRVAGEEWTNVGPLLLERRPGTTRVQAARLDSVLGTVSATGAIDDAGVVDIALQGRASLGVLAALRPEIREAAGTLEVSGRATGTMSAPRLTGGGTVSGGRVLVRDVPEPVTGIRGRFTLEGSRVRVTEAVATVSGGELRAGGTVDFAGPAPRLDLTLAGRLPLSALAALRPEVHEAAGVLEVDGRVSGTTAAPQASGEGTVRGGRVLLAAYPEALRDIQARFTVSPAGVRLASATASIGGGTVAAHGDLTLEGRALGPFRFDVEARGVTAEPVAGARTTWDADLELLGGASQALLRGEARLLRGAYVSETPLLQLLVSLGGRGGGGGGPSPALPLQVRVRLDDNLLVRTAVTRFRAGGTVTLQGTLAAPVLFGAVEVREGQLIFRKQRFTITAASARFTDPRRIDPILDVQAQARIQSYDVTLRLTGRGESLEIRLASTPALPEEDVLSLIAFGSTRQQLTRGGATAVAGEMAGLVLQDLFGLQTGEGGLGVDVEMETTEDDGRTVRLGRRLTDRTRVLYSQGIDRSDSRRLRLEYEVMGPFVIAGEQDFRGGFGGDVVVRLRFR